MNWMQKIGAMVRALLPQKPLFGIDVSNHNGLIDWAKVAQNKPAVDFAIIKATEGATSLDKSFIRNVKGCVENNIPWGAYHFATFNSKDIVSDATAEALHFIRTVQAAGKPDLPLVLDVESNKPLPFTTRQILMYIETFIDVVKKEGYEPAIYSSPGFLDSYLPLGHKLTNIKLWIAHYTTKPQPRTNTWKGYWLWQYTDKGMVNGIKTLCDLNRGS